MLNLTQTIQNTRETWPTSSQQCLVSKERPVFLQQKVANADVHKTCAKRRILWGFDAIASKTSEPPKTLQILTFWHAFCMSLPHPRVQKTLRFPRFLPLASLKHCPFPSIWAPWGQPKPQTHPLKGWTDSKHLKCFPTSCLPQKMTSFLSDCYFETSSTVRGATHGMQSTM